MSLLRSVLEHFVLPSGSPRPEAHEDFVPPDEGPDWACAEPAPRTPSGVALLTTATDAPVLAAALGLALAGRFRAPVAAVCVWTAGQAPQTSWRAPATPGARRLAGAFAGRGLGARAAGRLVIVQLPSGAQDAAAAARRAIAAAGSAPTVLALGGPRVAAFDALLSEQDLVIVATPSGTDPAVAQLALAGLAAGTVRTCACDVPASHPARLLAASGLMLLPSARRALAGPVEALS